MSKVNFSSLQNATNSAGIPVFLGNNVSHIPDIEEELVDRFGSLEEARAALIRLGVAPNNPEEVRRMLDSVDRVNSTNNLYLTPTSTQTATTTSSPSATSSSTRLGSTGELPRIDAIWTAVVAAAALAAAAGLALCAWAGIDVARGNGALNRWFGRREEGVRNRSASSDDPDIAADAADAAQAFEADEQQPPQGIRRMSALTPENATPNQQFDTVVSVNTEPQPPQLDQEPPFEVGIRLPIVPAIPVDAGDLPGITLAVADEGSPKSVSKLRSAKPVTLQQNYSQNL